jgi:TonB-dependent receptor
VRLAPQQRPSPQETTDEALGHPAPFPLDPPLACASGPVRPLRHGRCRRGAVRPAGARAGPGRRRARHGRGGDGDRHPPRHRERHLGQEKRRWHRRGDLGRGHRQAARQQHRRVDRAPARPDRAARRRPRTEINIRGLSGDFANTLLNGREQVSTGNNRSVEFDQYPSELLSGVTIYKTPDASLVGQGLSGTIDLQTVRPLNFGQRTVSVNLRGERNGDGTPFKGDGQRFNFSYIDQFANRTVGVAFGVARLTQNVTKSRNETYDENATFNFNGTNITHNQGFKYFVDATEETRDAAMAVLEIKPNKNFSSVVDLFYSKFEKDVTKRGIELQVNDSWKSGNPDLSYQAPGLTNATVQNGRLIAGTWQNVNPLARTIWEPREDELKSIGWNTRWVPAQGWSVVGDLSYSSAKSVEQITEFEAGAYDNTNRRPLPGTVTVANYNQVTAIQYDLGNPAGRAPDRPESLGPERLRQDHLHRRRAAAPCACRRRRTWKACSRA